MGKIKISFIARKDYANVLTNISNNINKFSKKYISCVICVIPSSYNYSIKHDFDVIDNKSVDITERKTIKKGINKWIDESRIIIFGDDILFFDEFLKRYNIYTAALDNKIIVPYYCGTLYRNDYNTYNNKHKIYQHHIFNPDLYRFSPSPDNDFVLLHSGPREIPLNIIQILKNKFEAPKIIIGHSPSSYSTKGTDIIIRAIEILSKKYNHLFEFRLIGGNNVPNAEILKSKEDMHIYIDQYNPNVGGPGISVYESLCYGMIVLGTFNNTKPEYYKSWKTSALPVVDLNCENKDIANHIYRILKQLCLLDRYKLIKKCVRSVSWTKKYLNEARFSNYFEKNILDKIYSIQ